MAERILTPSFSSSETQTITITADEVDSRPEDVRAVKLTLRKPKTDRGVKWSSDTVDNEHLNKKKSKCCCIYEKPKNFGESSSDEDDECENCFGHVELKRQKKNPQTPPPAENEKPVEDPNIPQNSEPLESDPKSEPDPKPPES